MVSEVSGLEWDDLDTTHFYVEPIVGGYEVVHDLTGWMGEFPDLPTAKQFAEVTHALSDV